MKTNKYPAHRIFALFLVTIFVILNPLFAVKAEADFSINNLTAEQAVHYAKTLIGKQLDFDKKYGIQCTDVIMDYVYELTKKKISGKGNAEDFESLLTEQFDDWTSTPYSEGYVPYVGDIFVRTAFNSINTGHIGIVIAVSEDGKTMTTVEQNYNAKNLEKAGKDGKEPYVTHSYKRNLSSLNENYCFVHPPFVVDLNDKTGYYVLESALDSSMAIDVAEGIDANETNIRLWEKNGTKAQDWRFVPCGDGYYFIYTRYGKVIDVYKETAENHTNIQIHEKWDDEKACQKWKLVSAGDGYVRIVSALNDDYVIDVSGGNTKDDPNTDYYDPNIQLYKWNDTDSQKFKIVET
jgi:hypothetical protein